jgi:ElaB/YqjD/DUF883 family membrane-anchored ribosome-binding protein
MTHTASRNDGNLKESAVAVKDAVADLASEAGRYASDRVGDAKDAAVAMVETVKTKAEDYNDAFIGFVRKNPYKSLAAAAGLGLAAGYLLRRR